AAGAVEKLRKGDICIIRKTSGGGKYEYGVIGIWFFYELLDIEGKQEPLWIPPDGWKYKIIMKPLVKEFKTLFKEDFSKDVEDQLRHKESTKVEGLIQTSIQGAVRLGFDDPNLPLRYLKAIIEEKKEECDNEAEYEDSRGNRFKIDVYEFLRDICEKKLVYFPPTNIIKTLNKHQLVKDFIEHLDGKGLKFKHEIIYRIISALLANKNVILTGPPGSGKTTLAMELADFFNKKGINKGFIPTTATSDWSAFETIGGYFPESDAKLKFNRGLFLEAIKENKWLIIDEINRAEIDKALGELHTVISGQSVLLPFKEGGKRIKIIPGNEDIDEEENVEIYQIDPCWRIIGTMNSYDKSFLYTLSYALMRRFSFIDISIPDDEDYNNLIDDKLQKITSFDDAIRNALRSSIKEIINSLSRENKIREIGPAIILDTIDYIEMRNSLDMGGSPDVLKYLGEGFILNLFPQFEGLKEGDYAKLLEVFSNLFKGNEILKEIERKIDEIKNIFLE
ncbi:MAG: AAA family ATPase, partial [Promethearchaeota archaeon]